VVKHLKDIFWAIRPINLGIIVLTLVLFRFLEHQFRSEWFSEPSDQYSYDLNLALICTILIAASGYILNDHIDRLPDKINKGRASELSPILSIGLYIAFNISALLLSLFIVSPIHGIFIGAIIGLFLYSTLFQWLPLIGNLTIAALSAMIPLIHILITDNYYFFTSTPATPFNGQLEQSAARTSTLFFLYIAFAFISTLAREIVKDIEDIEGDKAANYQTLPILVGRNISKMAAIFCLMITSCGVGLMILNQSDLGFSATDIIVIILTMLAPLIWSIVLTYKSQVKREFKRAGNSIKISMLGALIFLFYFALTL